MEKVVKSRKLHTCDVCNGNIQKGEKHILEQTRLPEYDNLDNQIGVRYYTYRRHNKDCFPRLVHFQSTIEILKNCNYGVHSPIYDMDPESYDDTVRCEWCGKTLSID